MKRIDMPITPKINQNINIIISLKGATMNLLAAEKIAKSKDKSINIFQENLIGELIRSGNTISLKFLR